MNASTKKLDLVKPPANPESLPFTPEMGKRLTIQRYSTGKRAVEYGFRLVCLADETNNRRWIDAAVQFAEDDALASGARGEQIGSGVQVDYVASAGGYTQTQLDAAKRLRLAKAALGPVYYQIVTDVVVAGLTANKLAKQWKISDKTALAWGGKALEALSAHYAGE